MSKNDAVPTCPVCGPIPNGHTVEHCVIAECERERAFDEKRLERWRDCRGEHRKANEFPTVNTVVACAEDFTDVVIGDYVLVIAHVLTFRGNRNPKAFMPRCYRNQQWDGNFNVYDTYEEALEKGAANLKAKVEEEERMYAAFCTEQEALRTRSTYGNPTADIEFELKRDE